MGNSWRDHHPLHLLRLITHYETEGWESWGQRAHTRAPTWTPTSPLIHPCLFLTTPSLSPLLISALLPLFCRWLALLLLLQLPRSAKTIVRNSDDSAPWCATRRASTVTNFLVSFIILIYVTFCDWSFVSHTFPLVFLLTYFSLHIYSEMTHMHMWFN